MKTGITEHLKLDEFSDRFYRSRPGTIIVYATGDLLLDRKKGVVEAKELCAVADFAWNLYRKKNRALLTQKRLGPNKYEYRLHVASKSWRAETEQQTDPVAAA